MLIDSHAHLDMSEFDMDREEVLERAARTGVAHIVSIGIDLDSSVAAIDLARKYRCVSASVGCHPHNTDGCKPSDLTQLAASIPLSRMLIETDSPFLSPVPKRGKRNEPSYVQLTAREIAKLRQIPFDEVARQTTENARLLFDLPV